MRKILLDSRNLWASDIFSMNDPDELTYAFSEILHFERDLVRGQFGKACVHIACFSNAEVLSQWKRYADECTGCAIGFDQSALKEWCLHRGISLFPMRYDLSRHNEMIERFDAQVNRLFEGRLRDRNAATETSLNKATFYRFSLAMTMKKQCWQHEREWRILIMQHKDERAAGGHTFNRLKRDDGVCYFELPICTSGLVTEVVVGPQCRVNSDELRQQLDDAGLGSVSVRRSLSESDSQ
jgi:hypothetical protein